MHPSQRAPTDLVSTESRFACPVHAPKKCSRSDLHRHKADLKLAASASWATGAENGPPGRICTRNFSFLRGAPLLVGLQGENGPHGRICTRTVSVLSGAPPSSWATWGKWCSRQDLHPRPSRSKRAALICCATGAKINSPAGHGADAHTFLLQKACR